MDAALTEEEARWAELERLEAIAESLGEEDEVDEDEDVVTAVDHDNGNNSVDEDDNENEQTLEDVRLLELEGM